MAIKPWLEHRANAEVGPRDGKADELEKVAYALPGVAELVLAPVSAVAQAAARRDEVHGVLAEKVLHAFVRNRLQISFPLSLNLSRHDEGEVDLLLRSAIMATTSAGGDGRANLAELLSKAGPSSAQLKRLEVLRRGPETSMNTLCDALIVKELAPHAFAMAMIGLPRPDACEQAFLTYFAERLGLRADVIEGLKRRYRR